MDGVPGVSQCAIPDNTEFTYEFDVGDQIGTYW
jgi:FtsP/CotA-like multicopper oxidase with cupredoxin domain